MLNVKRKIVSLVAVASLFVGFSTADACTGIRLKAEDGSIIAARTLEFEVDMGSNVIVVPRGYQRQGTTPEGKNGKKWTSKYASIGANGAGVPWIFDGFNEKGLGMGLFYHPTTAKYMPFKQSDAKNTLAPWELGSYILENFATVDEVKKNIGKIIVPATVFKAWGFVPPVHFVVHDASGKSIVIEYVKGKLVVYDNPLGVITNSPTFDWHMTNLRNYPNLGAVQPKTRSIGSVELKPFGLGAGLVGIPGDFTPPARFVRAVAFVYSSIPVKTGKDAVLQAFHILNNFDIPKGSAREAKRDKYGNIVADFTTWTSASNLKAKKYYFRTYDNSQIRMVNLNKMNLNAKKIVTIPMSGKEKILELRP
jgi:choloylglycine hydrolase